MRAFDAVSVSPGLNGFFVHKTFAWILKTHEDCLMILNAFHKFGVVPFLWHSCAYCEKTAHLSDACVLVF